MASAQGFILVICFLLAVVLFSSVRSKEPFLDFTCVASQSLIPSDGTSNVTISVHTPFSNGSITLNELTTNAFDVSEGGAFKCSLDAEEYEADTTVIISTKDASFYPPRLTVTYDPLVDDATIPLQMNDRDDCDGQTAYRWREFFRKSSRYPNEATLQLTSDHVANRSSIVFRHFFKKCESREGYVQVLFRECPSGKRSPEEDCQQDCSICLNGGMCHPRTEQCICPPGFNGTQCQNVHGRNVFGQQAQYSCNETGNPHDPGCRGKLFCLPEPFGCTCAAGYRGINCSEECQDGTFGANCEQMCHCAGNSTCWADTGKCVGLSCLQGWTGPNCQEPNNLVSLQFNDVNRNQTTNITCSVTNMSPFNENDFVLVLPNGTSVAADYFNKYRNPFHMMEYIFVIVADFGEAYYTCTDVNKTAHVTAIVRTHEPPQLLSPPTVVNSTIDTVTLTWDSWYTQAGDRGEGPVVKYIITYRELDGVADTETAGETGGNTTFFIVKDLMEATSYEFLVAAARPGVGGVGAPSPPTIGNTSCGVPGKPTPFKVVPINATSMKVSWSPPANTNCTSITYSISYWIKKQGQCKNIREKNAIKTNDQTWGLSYLIDQLLPDTTYVVNLESQTESGTSDIRRNRRTHESVPGPPILLSNETTNTSAIFMWKEPDCKDRNGVIMGYHFQLLNADMDTENEGVVSLPSPLQASFENLTPCTNYTFRVRGWTSVGNGTFSNPVMVTTQNGVPDVVEDLEIAVINSTQLSITWQPPTTPCPVIGYTVLYTLIHQGNCSQSIQAETQTMNVFETQADLSGLLPYSMYKVVVRAKNDFGEGNPMDKTKQTAEGVPGPPTSMTISHKTSDSLAFNWDPPDCTQRNGLIVGYRAILRNALEIVKTSDLNETSTTFDDLPACATFTFEVAAKTKVGLGEFSNVSDVMTESEEPEAVQNLDTFPDVGMFLVSWEPPDDPPCNIIGYNVTYKLLRHLACSYDDETKNEMQVFTEKSHFTVMHPSPHSEYLVSIVALTLAGAGEKEEDVVHTLQDIPSSPISVINTNSTPTSLTFTWEPPACENRNGEIKGYHYQLNDTATNTVTNGTTDDDDDSTMIMVEGLEPCTRYEFSVRARTVEGYGAFSNVLPAVTLGQAPSPVENLKVRPRNSTSLRLTWAGPVDTTCQITNYSISYKLLRFLQCPETETGSLWSTLSVNVDPRPNYIITGLSPASRYVVSVKAEMVGGFGVESTVQGETSEAAPGKPVSVEILDATPRSLAFAWKPPPCNMSNGAILSYNYKLAKTTDEIVLFEEKGTFPNITTAFFESLDPCTKYLFKVQAKTSEGPGPFTAEEYAATLGEAPSPVRNLEVQPINSTSLQLTWTEPADTTCQITNYSISYKMLKYLQCPEPETGSVWSTLSVNVEPHPSYIITGLSPASRYVVSVKAETVGGFGVESTVHRETLEAEPGPVLNASAVFVGQFSANFSWYPPLCRNRHGNIISYSWTLSRRESSRTEREEEATNTHVTVQSLMPCTDYIFHVYAWTSVGGGRETQVPFTTHPAVPEKVNEPSSRGRKPRSAIISWSSPDSVANPCPIQQYIVMYQLTELKECGRGLNETINVTTSANETQLEDLHPFSSYSVSVVARTAAGFGEPSPKLRFETKPAVPSAPIFVNNTYASPTSLSFTWEPPACEDRNGEITRFHYLLKDEANNNTVKNKTTDADVVTETLKQLEPCTRYEFKVRARTSKKYGSFSTPVYASTSDQAPSVVKNLIIQHKNSTSLQLTWNEPDDTTCPITEYSVSYKLIKHLQCPGNKTNSSQSVNAGVQPRYVITGLSPASQYVMSVMARTVGGFGMEQTVYEETSEAVPTGPPQNIAANETETTFIHFIWQPPLCDQQNGQIVDYTYTLLDSATNETAGDGNTRMTDVLIRDLYPYVEHIFTVWANTAVGPGPSSRLVVRTNEGVPPQPKNFAFGLTDQYTLEVEWDRPTPPNGIISAYQIEYWQQELDKNSIYRDNLTDTAQHRYTIRGLKPYTQYYVRVRGKTGAGYGDWSVNITRRTDQAAPEKPASADVTKRTENTIAVKWKQPNVLNGVLTGYKIEYKVIDNSLGPSDVVQISSEYEVISASKQASTTTLNDLRPATGYEIRIAAETVEVGEYEVLQLSYTKIPVIDEKPTMPAQPALSDDNIVTLQLRPISSPYVSVYQVTVTTRPSTSKRDTTSVAASSYQQSPENYMYIAAEFDKSSLPSTFQVGDNQTYGVYYNAPLQYDTKYDVQLCGVGRTEQDTQQSCSEPSSVTTNPFSSGPGVEAIIGAVIAVLVVIVLILVVMVIIRKRQRFTKSDYDDDNGVVLSNIEKAQEQVNGVQNQNQTVVEEIARSTQLRRSGGVKGQSTTPVPQKVKVPPPKAWKPHKPISLQELPAYVKQKKADNNKEFVKDYASFPNDQLYSCDAACKDANKNKNRYANILPYDNSRVVLDQINDDPDTDYINASFIDGYKKKNAYIATQGHNKYSIPDFWRMVWQQEVAIIVMLTNLVENGKKKCTLYWPEDQQNYDNIVVKLASERVEQDFTERVFIIANINIDEDIPREVRQFHYTTWPDMGLPDSPAPIMNFIHEIKQVEEENTGPMVVHCSAGVGRTGTFMTVDTMLNKVAEERQINVIDFVYEMRKKRTRMVQTQDQYMFIYEVLLETLLCGDTVMNIKTFPEQYEAMQHQNPLTGNLYLEEHFRVLDAMSATPSDNNCHGARNKLNLDKNRFSDCIPLDKSRPYLMSPGDENGTNYINASFVDSYKKKDGFLATQSPLPNTIIDFWRMVYDYKARVVVMLNQIDGSDETCAPYWIDDPEEIALYGVFEVQLRDCKSFKHTVARTFKLKNTSKASEKPRTIHHFAFHDWADQEVVPSSLATFLGFMELVESGQQQAGTEGRVAVHCLDGVSRSGLFCASMASLQKLKQEKVIDVFHAVRNLRRNRHSMVDTQDQYLFIYEFLDTYLEENQTYANFR